MGSSSNLKRRRWLDPLAQGHVSAMDAYPSKVNNAGAASSQSSDHLSHSMAVC